MAAEIVEYLDERGRKHRAASVHDVPPRYMKSMLVIGGDDSAAQPAARTGSEAGSRWDPRIQAWLDKTGAVNWDIAAPVLLAVVWFKSRGFLMRVLVIGAAFIWGFHLFYGWFENSRYSRPAERPKAEDSARGE